MLLSESLLISTVYNVFALPRQPRLLTDSASLTVVGDGFARSPSLARSSHLPGNRETDLEQLGIDHSSKTVVANATATTNKLVEEERTARFRLSPNIKDNSLSFITGQWPDGLGSSLDGVAETSPRCFYRSLASVA